MLKEWLTQHATDPQIYCTWTWIFYARRRAQRNSVTESFTCVSCCHILGSEASDGSQGRKTLTHRFSVFTSITKSLTYFPLHLSPNYSNIGLSFLATSSELNITHRVSRRSTGNFSSAQPSWTQAPKSPAPTSHREIPAYQLVQLLEKHITELRIRSATEKKKD